MTENGTKNDQGKPAMELVPPLAVLEVGKVMGAGAGKYSRYNWLDGLRCTRLAAAALRHIFQWISGETFDKETGLNHLAHAACCCLMALETQIRKPELDDRYKPVGVESTEFPNLTGVKIKPSTDPYGGYTLPTVECCRKGCKHE